MAGVVSLFNHNIFIFLGGRKPLKLSELKGRFLMKITMIPDENHVQRDFCLTRITMIPDEDHVSKGLFPEENHDIRIRKLMSGTISSVLT